MFTAASHKSTKASTREQSRGDAARNQEERRDSNPVWQSLALSPVGLQAKLAVSQPDDPYEREADRVADNVMRMAAPESFSRHSPGVVQRKCAGCEEEEEKIQRKEQSAATEPATVSSSVVDRALNSTGRPLDETTRDFMEPRFGYDLGHVRVHDDTTSASSAVAINAKAYTIGPHIVFGAGMYQPQSSDGRRLLAHELAHTVQQASSPRQIQRDVSDFRVTKVQPDPVERTKGKPVRFFFEIEQSEFRDSVPAEKKEKERVQEWGDNHKFEHVTLVGRASQEGSRWSNRELAHARATTVSDILTDHHVDVDEIKVDMTYEDRPVDYRYYRSVEIESKKDCDSKKDLAECEAALVAAHKRATDILTAAMTRLRPDTDPQPQPNSPARQGRDAVLATHFKGTPRATLLPLFESIVTRLGQVKDAAGHTCNDRCQEKCERAASATAGGPVVLCPAFYDPDLSDSLSKDMQVFLVLHETTHSAVVKDSKPPKSVGIDFAYSTTRMFEVLEAKEALENADSFVMTMLILAESAGGAPAVLKARGPAPADNFNFTTPAGEKDDRNRTAKRAIGFAESWLNYCAFWSPRAYDFIAASLGSWTSGGGTGHALVELWAAPFELNHPGNREFSDDKRALVESFQKDLKARGYKMPPKSSHATTDDRTKVAGIYDRYKRMLQIMDSPLTVGRAASGDGFWSTGVGLPGLSTTVQLADSFFTTLSNSERTRHIIRLMARGMSDLPKSWEEAYVEGADGVRQYRELGP
ncbi:MAG TPA: DUF4157 domain-containing protein [Pyrinomonadaceae bacterium]